MSGRIAQVQSDLSSEISIFATITGNFCPREKQPRITRIKRIGRNPHFIRGIRVTCRAVASREGGSAVQQFLKVF